MRKPTKPKVRLYHVEFSDKGAEILIIPATAHIKTIGDGLRVMQGQKLLAHLVKATNFWELGTIARQPTTLGKSQAEIEAGLEVPFFRVSEDLKFNIYGPSRLTYHTHSVK